MYNQNKSFNFGQYIPNDKVLNKKIPENPKFRNVRPAVDSGKNVKRHVDELKEKQKNVCHNKDEVFFRVKFSSFIKLSINVARCLLNEGNITVNDAGNGIGNSIEAKKEENNRMANVLMGIGEIDLRNEKKKPPVAQPKVEKTVPYLLLDVRDREKFLECHLKTAKHYPSALISRSIGYEIEEMKQYKNNHPAIIILYDDDESIATRVATTLVQRGYENIYVLSGGLKMGSEVLPRGLMNLITSCDYPASKMGSCGMVQIKIPSSEYFTQKDIDNIEQYLEDYSHKGHNPACSSKTYSSFSKDDQLGSLYQKTGDDTEFTSNQGYTTYRKDSACNLKNTKQTQIRIASGSATDGRLKAKKAPWK